MYLESMIFKVENYGSERCLIKLKAIEAANIEFKALKFK